MERYEAALADYRRAAELAAGDVAMLTDLADAHQYLGHWEEAAKAYRTAIGTKTDHARAYQNAAWLMATCPDERIRRPDLAVAAAQKAIELSGAPTAEQLDTLAAAHAASGNNRQAIATARQALRLADDESLAGEIRARIELYNSGQAYIQPASEQAVAVAEPPRQQSSHVARTPSELRRK